MLVRVSAVSLAALDVRANFNSKRKPGADNIVSHVKRVRVDAGSTCIIDKITRNSDDRQRGRGGAAGAARHIKARVGMNQLPS